MCLSVNLYPVVKFKDIDKSKILFKNGIHMSIRDDLSSIPNLVNGLKKVYNGVNTGEFVKMVSIPCGKCSECLSNRSRTWAYRILREASRFDNNYFITLTYDDEHLPFNHMLVYDEIKKFNKKLRTYLDRKGLKSDFRFYAVGEYGSQQHRPHYHVIYFNLDIPDLCFVNFDKKTGFLHFDSKFIADTWSKGLIDIGSVDVGSACYVARYCDKKKLLSKDEKDAIISKGIVPEFSVMSRMPGIGADNFEDIVNDFENGDFVDYVSGVVFSKNLSPYYNKKMKDILVIKNPAALEQYELQAKINMNAKIAKQATLSDYVNLDDNLKDNLEYNLSKKRGKL